MANARWKITPVSQVKIVVPYFNYTSLIRIGLSALLKEWQDLLFAVKSLSLKKAKQSGPIGMGEGDEQTAALVHGEMARLSQSLKQLIEESALNRSFTSTVGCLRSLDDIIETQELFQVKIFLVG